MDEKRIERVLFVGNSITKHPIAPELGWFGEWGMAASSEEKDYVHLLMREIHNYYPKANYQSVYAAAFERSYWDYDLVRLKELRQFEPDLIIMKIGENVNDVECVERNFQHYFLRLIDYLNPTDSAAVIIVNGFWANKYINEKIRMAAEKRRLAFVDLSSLHGQNIYMAKDQFENEGVGLHPSDVGMEEIAHLIWKEIVSLYELN